VRVLQSPTTPKELSGFRPYLLRTVVNLVRDHRRRQARWADLRFWWHPSPDPADESQRHHRDQTLAVAMRQLKQAERLAVYLRFFEEASYDDIGRILGRREGNVRVLVHRALRKLREALGQEGLRSPGEEA
jgi:RNA polymerase sigma factor (sigma-70 family)